MDKQAFKQRMQNLKSYRENNPGKGYWDWRNSLPDNLKYTDDTEYDMVGAYNSGAQPTLEDDGSYHLPTRVPSTGKVLKSSIHPTYWKGLAEDEKLGYHTYWLPDGSTYTASKYDAPIQAFADGGQNNTPIVDSLNKEQLARIETRDGENQYERIMKNDKSITESLLKSGYYQFNAGELPEVKIGPEQLYAELNTYYPITSRYPFTGHSEIITPEKSSISLSGVARKYNLITNNCSDATRCALENVFGKKVNPIAFTTPGDVRDFASENLNAIKVKSYEPGTTTQLIPLTNQQAKQLEYEAYKAYRVNNNLPVVDIETFWKRYYTKADSFQNGGEVDEFQRKTRRDIMQQSLVDGRPNYNKMFQNQNEYQKDLEDADISELTNTFAYNMYQDPVQYIANRDVYNAVTERDWAGAGLAALGVLPFIPSGLRQLKPTARYIPSVSKSREQDLLNVAFDNIKQKREYLSDVANERNRVLESVNDYAHRVRAEKADQMFGTNYSDTYKLLSDLYEHRFFSLPEVQGLDMKEIGKMQAKKQANKKFVETGIGAGPEDFDFLVNPYRPIAADELARHELNHYTDFIISRNRDTSINNNMLKQLESSLRKTNDVKGDYFKLGTEQKAYMNQLRTRMYNDKAIDSLEEPVSTTLIKKYMDSLDDKDSIKRAYKQHKSLSAYTKWFNSIPLLGIGAIGVNKYFNNGTEQEK